MAARDDGMITVYVCWHERPSLHTYDIRRSPRGMVELVGFDQHPLRDQIIALAGLFGAEPDRARFSVDFPIPREWVADSLWTNTFGTYFTTDGEETEEPRGTT